MGNDTLSLLDFILTFAISSLISLGLLQKARLRHALSRIPIRIHVNGTRGKSSVTRLIAAGLRNAGINTMAKTTGTYPRIILEDGSEIPAKRRGKANIKEQINVICMAGRRGAKALILECNAIQPEYQWVSEHRIFQSTMGVITNVRRDHTDAMGESLEEIARSLSNTIPSNAILITGEERFLPIFEKKATSLKTKVVLSEKAEGDILNEKGQVLLFPENFALSLKVCEFFGVEKNTALKGMLEAFPDPAALQTIDLTLRGKQVRFVNAFSANDTDSVDHILRELAEQGVLRGNVYAMLNNRKDRVFRALEFARFIATRKEFEKNFMIGDLTRLAWKEALRHGAEAEKLFILRSKNPDKIMNDISNSVTDTPATLIGMGNFGGLGEKIITYLQRMVR